MNTSRKYYEILLKRYPDAHNITRQVAGLASEDKTKSLDKNSFADDFISQLTLCLPDYPANKNLFDVLQHSVAKVFYSQIKELLSKFESLILNKEELALNLSRQGVHTLPDDIRQVCFFASQLQQMSQQKISSWEELFEHFPIIEKRLTLLDRHMIIILDNMLTRLDKDKETLTNSFNIRLFSIKSIQLFLGDFHQTGKSVVRIDFSTHSVIYKPEGADNEAFVLALLDIINAEIMDLRIGVPAFINMHEYSWHEYITFQKSDSVQDELAYYRNIGASLLLFYLLNGSGFHPKNIICVNDTPYFVDLKMIFSRPQQAGLFTDSLLNTLIVPSLAGDPPDSSVCGITLLRAEDEFIQTTSISIDNIVNMYPQDFPGTIKDGDNVHTISDSSITYTALINAINEGFDCMRDLIKNNQQIASFIKNYPPLKGKVVFRPSHSYHEMIRLAMHPAYASDLEARNIYLSCILYEETNPLDVIQYEHGAISEGRIPVFYMNMVKGKYYTADNIELNINDNHSFKDYMTKVYRMINTDEESALQKKLMNLSLATLSPAKRTLNKKDAFIEKTVSFMAGEEIRYKKKEFILNIETDISGARCLNKMSSDIYNGLSGATFMQLCNFIVNRTSVKEKRLYDLYSRAQKYNTNKTFGCFEMNGGLLYLEYLFHKNLIDWFDISLFNQRLINIIKLIKNRDPHVDIMSGMAGILIVCSRMYLLCPHKIYESAIKFLASAIMQKALYLDTDIVAWRGKLTGFALGNSGIIYALLLANNILNNKEIHQLAIHALKYEQKFKISQGWKDMAMYGCDEDANCWHHGAAGIYLSRAAMLNENYFADSEIKDILYSDIEHYHSSKKERGINNHPSLCFGAYGNAMIDPLSYAEYLHVDYSEYTPAENKSLMIGRPGALYSHLFINHSDREMPNLLLLK